LRTIALISSKGGAGKTTLALSLAVQAERAGLPVVLLDLDPQGSAASWGDARGADNPPDVVPAQAPRLPGLLASAARQGAQLAVVDTPPNADSAALAAAKAADLVLIPCRPSALDLAAIAASVRLAQEIAGKPVYVVLNAVVPRTTVAEEALRALTDADLEVAPVRIHHRQDHVTPLGAGQVASEWAPKSKAAAEIESLWKWVTDTMPTEQQAFKPAGGRTKIPT
jgi:chromosome partitioning protein